MAHAPHILAAHTAAASLTPASVTTPILASTTPSTNVYWEESLPPPLYAKVLLSAAVVCGILGLILLGYYLVRTR